MNVNVNKAELVKWIHQEIAAKGTSSKFFGHGLDKRTGNYDADKIADRLISGALKIKGLDIRKFAY